MQNEKEEINGVKYWNIFCLPVHTTAIIHGYKSFISMFLFVTDAIAQYLMK